jgi:hypothetical protein
MSGMVSLLLALSTGETPRRSVRISAKAKVTESPEDERPKKKRGRKPLSEKKKEEQELKDMEEKEKEADAEPTDGKAKKAEDAEIKDAELVKDADEATSAADTAMPDQNSGEKVEENNEAKPKEPIGPDAAPIENNVGAEGDQHGGGFDVNGN